MSITFIIILTVLAVSISASAQERVKTGDEIFVEKYLELIKGKSIGIVTNHSGLLPNGRHIADVLAKVPGVKLVALFGPEHGIRGNVPDAEIIPNSVDEKTGVPVYSLYGDVKQPTAEMLRDIDVLIYDIQDVGVRFYTFISTMQLTMEAAAVNHIKFIVLDRPDMLRPDMVEGPVLVDSLRSFVGMQPIPSVYGMTPGEYATMINEEHMLDAGLKVDLVVIKMGNYRRDMWYDQTGLKWINPSPNLPNMNTVEVYPGTVLIEGTNVSEGRGTDHPFETIGAPYINGDSLARLMNEQHLAGVTFEPVDFTPRALPWVADPKYNGKLCHGVKITVTDRNNFRPVEMGIYLISVIKSLSPANFEIRADDFDILSGVADMRILLESNVSPQEIVSTWNKRINKFRETRDKYLLYR
ncbi:MAG: DUF1343 domain-containing protein [Bacteroidetes bacterium]|nr:DUF1343 domain-containing protein [Bacteroidota bacterium]